MAGVQLLIMPRNSLPSRGTTEVMALAQVDFVLVAIIGVILLFIFAVYLMLRRTLLAFSEGMREGRNR